MTTATLILTGGWVGAVSSGGGGGTGATAAEVAEAVWAYNLRTLTSGVTQIGSAPDPVLSLADAVAGATRPSQLITWMRDATTPEPLTGATLTGRIRDEQTLQIRSITGTLSVTDGPSGTFTWAYSAADVEMPGNYSVQFTATFGSSPTTARTVAGEWLVHQAY